MSNTTVVDNAKDHVWHHLTQHKAFEENDPLVVTDAKGMILTDSKGDEYLDATSGGVWTVNLGTVGMIWLRLYRIKFQEFHILLVLLQTSLLLIMLKKSHR